MNLAQWQQTPQATINFGLILMVVVLNGIVVHRNTLALNQTYERVVQSYDLPNQLEAILGELVESESGVRTYAVTGEESYLSKYRHVSVSLPDRLRDLQSLVKNNAAQSEKIRELEQHVIEKLNHFQSLIATRSEHGFDAARALITSGAGDRAMNQARHIVESLKKDESNLLLSRTETARKELYTVLISNIAAVCLILLISGVAWKLIDSHVRTYVAAEAKADAERENLLVTLTSIGDAVVVTDSSGYVKLINPVAKQLLGSPDEVTGKPLRDVFTIINESTRQPAQNPVARAIEIGNVVELEDHTLLLRPDGTEVPIESTAAPIRNRSNKISGVVLVFRDCSARWKFESELKHREQRFRILFETPLIGIAVGTSGGKYLLEANDAYLDLIGYAVGELPGASLGWGGVEPGQSPLDESAQRELLETGVCHPFERTCTRSDGTVVPVMISATRLFDEKDRVIVFITDLSSIKQSEAALRESQKRFHTLSESMPQMVWTALPDGKIDYVNRTLIEYSGLPEEQLKGWGWTALLHKDDGEAYIAAWKAALASGQPLEMEHRLRERAGEYRWHLTRTLPVSNAADQITLWVGTNTNIHDHKIAEALLKEEHLRKDQFLALLAHELRNPLAPLGNAIQVLPAVQDDRVQSSELIAIMDRQVKQLTRLIDDLLDLARISQGRILLRRQRTLVATVAAAAVESVQPWITEHEHQLTVNVPAEDIFIDADAARLSQVLTNLLQNAAKYTAPKGQISLTVERAGNEILFRVKDNGPGLSASMLNRIFDLFVQAEQTLDRARGGLGIGLTLVRTLVELHGGKISAHSEGLGRGSEFIVRLPFKDERAVLPAPSTKPAKDAATLPARNVLVVDDVEASAKTLAMMLTVLGQKVETAFDGLDAIARVAAGSFDIVFLDIAMPGIDGLEVARRLRANSALSKLTLVALTGFGQDADRQRSFEVGFNEHLIKPTSIDQLREVLLHASRMSNIQRPAAWNN